MTLLLTAEWLTLAAGSRHQPVCDTVYAQHQHNVSSWALHTVHSELYDLGLDAGSNKTRMMAGQGGEMGGGRGVHKPMQVPRPDRVSSRTQGIVRLVACD